MKKHFHVQAGFSLIETMVAMGLLGILVVTVMWASSLLLDSEMKTQSYMDEAKLAQSLLESFKSDPALYQKNFAASSVDTNTILNVDTLPLAYGKNFFGKRSDCSDARPCEAYIGFVFRPTSASPGLFQVNLRIYFYKKKETRDYVMLTQAN